MAEDDKSGLERHEDYPAIIVVIVMLALFSLAGTIGNALVIYVYSRKREKTTTTIFILTLAGTDFFTCLIIIPYTIAVEYVAKKIKYDSACKIYQFLITSNVPFSAFIMVVIAFDRYLKICRPWNHILNAVMAKRTIICLLIFAAVLGIITALVHGVPNEPTSVKKTEINSTGTTISAMPLSTDLDIISRQNSISRITAAPDAQNITFQTNQSVGGLDDLMALYKHRCIPNEIYIGKQVRSVFQKFCASLFLIACILVFILYTLVFRSLALRRSRKAKRKLLSNGQNTTHNACATTQTCAVTTKLTMAENGEVETFQMTPEPESKKSNKQKRTKSLKGKHRAANIKTAGILFIVTIVFIIAFLPAWLMAMRVLQGNIILFYMHYSYNVANPIIYAFFNQNFRQEMKSVFHCR